MSEDLKVLQPGREITVSIKNVDTVLVVKPFKTGQLLKVIKPITEIAKVYSSSNGSVIEMIAAGGDKIVELVCLSTTISKKDFEDLELDQSIDLIAAIIGENKEFFEKKLSPAIERFNKTINSTAQNTGEASTQD